MMHRAFLSMIVVPFLLLGGCFGGAGPVGNIAVPQPAKPIEISRYLGLWYEMARYEAPFQKGCDNVTADYTLRDDGKISVLNSCVKDGETTTAKGRAKIVEGGEDAAQNAKLKVSFFGPFYGDYWVLDRAAPNADGQYDWSIVGEPSGRYLWMLTRDAQPDDDVRAAIKARVIALGYDWSLVRQTKHD
jgi:apolipoprotein D and lipocalin family protein